MIEAGKTYDITPAVSRVKVRYVGGNEYADISDAATGDLLESVRVTDFTWTEVEPEYVVGALYMDAGREESSETGWTGPRAAVYIGSDSEGWCWRRPNDDLRFHNSAMLRPLTRLYREGEQ